MLTYQTLSAQPRAFLAMTGLTTAEFRDLLPTFETAYERAFPRALPRVGPATGGSGAADPALSGAPRTNSCSSWST
jgi:hypothetical protein